MLPVSDQIESVAHVIQVALTPVFLFSGIATLLSVLSLRLGRVADRVDTVAETLDGADAAERRRLERRLAFLRRRTLVLDLAVILAALAGVSTLLSAALLFVGDLRDKASVALFFTFGFALLAAVGALTAFMVEMMLASVGIRDEAANSARRAQGPQ